MPSPDRAPVQPRGPAAVPASSSSPPRELIETEAQRALRERPSFSIRARLSVGFGTLFILSLAITVVWMVVLVKIQNKLHFLELAGNYRFEIQQARRFEKNYFLYGTNLHEADEHTREAQRILQTERDKLARVVGATHFRTMERHFARYQALIHQLIAPGAGRADREPPHRGAVEAELRAHGADMMAFAEELVAKERQSVNTMLLASQRIPLLFLLVLLALIVYMTSFIARQMLRPLNRLMAATSRVAEGDFTPITPQRRYRDEFTGLALALNHMMHQLVHRQELLMQSHKLQAVGTLTAGVAHELNNPINNIMLTAAMLEEDYPTLSDEERLEMVRDLLDQAERSQRIVRNLLDFARESELKVARLQVNELIEETLQLAANQLKLAKVKVVRDLAENLPPIHGDRQQLSQVLLNIVLNAIDAMHGGGTITLASGKIKDGDYVLIEIGDSGSGIPEHILPNIFVPFFTTKPTGKGTGLGLSVSLGIVRHHGGDIAVRSKLGEGTVVGVELPTAKVPASRMETPP